MMKSETRIIAGRENAARSAKGEDLDRQLFHALPIPAILVGAQNEILSANNAAQSFFFIGKRKLRHLYLRDLLPFASPILSIAERARGQARILRDYNIDIGSPHIGFDKKVDVSACPLGEISDYLLISFHERDMAGRLQRQDGMRSATRFAQGLSAALSHEIRNPLSGIRGAAQLLAQNLSGDDETFAHLIISETDRITDLLSQTDMLAGSRHLDREAVNMHKVFDDVRRLALSGFAKDCRIERQYDPSLPPIWANRDQLVQVVLNLVKNAAEALADQQDKQIIFTSAYRTGFHINHISDTGPISLPLEFCVIDNGPGIDEQLLARLFEPFVSGKGGSGLGLAIAAKIMADHDGILEYDDLRAGARFRMSLPAYMPHKSGEYRQSDTDQSDAGQADIGQANGDIKAKTS